jgi:mono/diheme cytochrome c family protein
MAAWVCLLLSGCADEALQRMKKQPKGLPYRPSALFDDGRLMRDPPLHTVARERELGSAEWMTGRKASEAGGRPDGPHVQKLPVQVTPELLARGRKRFEITCAACHGFLGDGESMVARNMSLRPPPSLHALGGRPAGYLFEVQTQGYGLMPSFGQELSTSERWAVVAYVQALQRSQRASLQDAPERERAKLISGVGP